MEGRKGLASRAFPALSAPERPGDGSRSFIRWVQPPEDTGDPPVSCQVALSYTSLCPLSTQIHAKMGDWLVNGSSFTTCVPRLGGLVPRRALPTGKT